MHTKDALLLFAAVAFLLIAGVASDPARYAQVSSFLASVFFVDSSTPEMLHTKYAEARTGGEKMKILIVPGHDDIASGAAFGGLREADLNLALGAELHKLLAQVPDFNVAVSRTEEGYVPALAAYFTEHRVDINAYRADQQAQMRQHLASGAIESNVIVSHNFAPSEVALRLWGINKWANDNRYDLIIHIHFNDVPRAVRSKPGAYSGFSMYIPERQFSNAKGSRAVAESIRDRLARLYPKSDLPVERDNPTEDQELIAIGSNNSLDAATVLIEYAYIYEPIIQQAGGRSAAIADMALQTYLGVRDFFEEVVIAEDDLYTPHRWSAVLKKGDRGSDVLALQAALAREATYPPQGKSRNESPPFGR